MSVPKLPKSIKDPNQLLQQSRGALKTVIKHAHTLLTIQATVRDVVPGEIEVSSLLGDELHLITPSAALATRIKYSQRALIAALRKQKKPVSVENIKITVRPAIQPKPIITKPPIPPSVENSKHLATAAQYIEDEACLLYTSPSPRDS